ncbi:MAG: radical SAM protein [Kiritimatiellaeota bacterium]|nr:radical SAM protein [Kiritimatiellota bacterium]
MFNPSASMPAPSILPATAVLEMTAHCNHACLFCSCPWFDEKRGGTRGGEMPLDEWKELISTYAAAGVVNFCFTGGEPLLKEGLEELIDFAASVKARHIETVNGALKAWDAPPRLYLLSNGKLVDDRVLALCARHDVALSMSLPGLATFDEHTGGTQPVAHVLDLFRKAREMGVSTTAGITVTQKNFHELSETIAMALIAGADRVLLNRFMPGGRGLANRGLELTIEQIRAIPDIAEEVLAKAKRHGHIGTEYPRCLVDPAKYEYLKVGTRCAAATDFFVVGPSGMLRVCNHSPVDLAHWRDYDSLRKHPYWRTFVHKSWTPKGCENCALLGVECDGGCREAAHVANGGVEAADPVFRGEPPAPFLTTSKRGVE